MRGARAWVLLCALAHLAFAIEIERTPEFKADYLFGAAPGDVYFRVGLRGLLGSEPNRAFESQDGQPPYGRFGGVYAVNEASLPWTTSLDAGLCVVVFFVVMFPP
jgi:hypothetical protein